MTYEIVVGIRRLHAPHNAPWTYVRCDDLADARNLRADLFSVRHTETFVRLPGPRGWNYLPLDTVEALVADWYHQHRIAA